MFFSLDVLPARKGDCLIVHYGTPEQPGLVLIDGGPAQVYQPHLKPRLEQIRHARGLEPTQSLPVDVLMVSHIDDDHINGVLELTKELVNAQDDRRPLPLRIRSFWYNTFDDILGNDPQELRGAVTAQFGPAALAGEPDTEGLDAAAALVLASVGQGVRLRDDARKLKLRLNPEFNGTLIQEGAAGKDIDIGRGLSFTVAGPMTAELTALQKEHAKWLKKQAEEQKTKEALAAFTDTSIPNLSSIVLIAEVAHKRILFTGDARGDKILLGLEQVGALKPGDTLHVEILKMPHHGSNRNMDRIFFQRITADHYVFSGNGEHGNPERETLQMLLDERGRADFTVHLTYPIDEIDRERKKDWEKEQAKEKTRNKKNSAVKVRADWSPEQHSLTALFAAQPAFAKTVRIAEPGAPHVIDLLDPLGF